MSLSEAFSISFIFNKTLLHKSSEEPSLVSGPRLNFSPPEAENPSVFPGSATIFQSPPQGRQPLLSGPCDQLWDPATAMSVSHAKTLQKGDMEVSVYGSWITCRSEARDRTQDAHAILEPQAPESTRRTEQTPDASLSLISAWTSASLEQAGSTTSASSPHLWEASPLSVSLRTETVGTEGDLCLCLQLFCLKIHIFLFFASFLKIIFIYFGLFFLMYIYFYGSIVDLQCFWYIAR